MVAVPPVPKPVTTPLLETVATPVALLLQVPPDVASESEMVVPEQSSNVVAEVIAAGGVQAILIIHKPLPQVYPCVWVTAVA